ncbi:hypothetical protein SARC_02312 [Sphaeroforma arctica JP610]|uniref:Uncharacterized protein n=1 Tax=Sphaeroforma arctica JP610 TaxID=667725 RepID=A0A0L0G9E7_9EUKA|nr:hypothetical protein SARC_02312 [Sphaeroforma arctica JP610]KNC85511.1 hypothetical protein SARC_02312 [Sphaeroforma arctica JP610]|eukprot:XP_014159413.1 hypothetical protein SARC_02312 [Sphaeroforma arctica JP610]
MDILADDSQFATEKLMAHIAVKGFQLGSVLGLLVVSPVALVRTGRWPSRAKIGTWTMTGSVIGAIGASALGLGKKSTFETPEEIEDRVYRLRHNKGQLRTDRFWACGAVIGMLGGAALGSGVVGGLGLGQTFGTLAHIGTSYF